ncbi:MAG: hypothetical protein LCH84_10910 [Gemmatimonadetes bacterium]|nr:hypothetical protein [Gemmatimonadota bacterium]
MMALFSARAATVALLSGALLPVAGLGAQECQINDGSPFQLAGAKQYIVAAANAKKEDEVPKHLANAIRVLTDSPEKIKNEAGRQYLLLRAYAQYMQREEGKVLFTRGDMGFTANPQGKHNLLMAVDSAATAVETLMPQCKATVRPYRQRFFTDVLNKSITAMNADQNDSAVYYAGLARQVGGGDPAPWNVMAVVYQKQNKMDSAMMAMDKVIQLAGTDSAYKRVKQQSRYNLAVLTLQQAEAASGDSRDGSVKKARGLLEDYLKDSPGDANAAQALSRALRLSGDTTAVTNMLADMRKNAETFSADQLFEAASNAAASGKDADAAGLFESGLKKNPYHRVALYNYANVLFALKDTQKMGPIVQRLVSVDPNFDRGYRLVAGYWQLMARAETDAAKKKIYNDSTLYYLDRQTKTIPRVDVTLAAKAGNQFRVEGTIVNEGQAAGSWTMKLELLDETGAVVATKDVAVGPLDAGANTTFAVRVEAPKAVAYRYAPMK